MSKPAKSVWAIVNKYGGVYYGSRNIHGGREATEYYTRTLEKAEQEAAELNKWRPDFSPHRTVRYDLVDPERDRADADAIDFILNFAVSGALPSGHATEYLAERNAALARVLALRDRLRKS